MLPTGFCRCPRRGAPKEKSLLLASSDATHTLAPKASESQDRKRGDGSSEDPCAQHEESQAKMFVVGKIIIHRVLPMMINSWQMSMTIYNTFQD